MCPVICKKTPATWHAGAASATAPAANAPSEDTGPPITPRITLGEEEISDVSLGTFYVFDKENETHLGQDINLQEAADMAADMAAGVAQAAEVAGAAVGAACG